MWTMEAWVSIRSARRHEHTKWKAAGVTAVIGLGSNPGLSNIICRAMADRLDRIDRKTFTGPRRRLVRKARCSFRPTAFVLVVLLGLGSIALTAHGKHTKEKGGDSVTVTGCLQKGDKFGEYSITGEDGRRYSLRSRTVELFKHVGHKVTVTGTKMREENEDKEKKEARGGEYADLRVTDLKMISETCQ
jgi:hypothetical protein